MGAPPQTMPMVSSVTMPPAHLSPPAMKQRAMPPPPMTAAPVMPSPMGAKSLPPLGMALPSPKASGAHSPDSDMKVLLDLAVASGNQAAVDAVLRQAQQSGVSPGSLLVSGK